MNGGERVKEKDLCRSPRASPYNLSEVSRGNKQRRSNFGAHVRSSTHTIISEFLKMVGSFLRTKEITVLHIIKKTLY